MKKIFTMSLAVVLSASAFAETVKILSVQGGIPGIDEPQLYGLGISPNGKYVCGAIEFGNGIFVADAETSEVKWSLCSDEGGELRHIDNYGKAIGISDYGITYSFDYPKETEIKAPEGVKYFLADDLTNDGKMYVGALVLDFFETKAVYRTENGEYIDLPVPSKEEQGDLFVGDASAAKLVSAEGEVIFGFLGSFGIPILWTRNADDQYEYDYFASRFINNDDTEVKLFSISGMYYAMSNDGKYVCMMAMADGTGSSHEYLSIPIVYNTQTKEMKYYTGQQAIDEDADGLYPCAIANDGTFVGSVGMPYYGAKKSFIMKAGATEAETYNEAFPTYRYKLGEADELGFNMVTGMSADGRYILGYTWTSEDFYDESPGYYCTYIIDTQGNSGVENISDEMTDPTPQAIYDINGMRKDEMTRGVNIVRMSDGSVRKVMK